MIQGRTIYTSNFEEFSFEIYNIIIQTVDICIKDKQQCFIAVSGGTTPGLFSFKDPELY